MKQAADSRKICRLLGEVELTSHQLGKTEPGIRFLRFSYVQPKQIWNHIIIYWIEVFYGICLTIQEPVISLVRGQAK
jgi:hypothetical protein